MHGVDQHLEIGAADVSYRAQRRRDVANGETWHRLHHRADAAPSGEFGQHRELIEGTAEVAVEAHHIDPWNVQFSHDVQIGGTPAHVAAGNHQEAVSQRDGDAVMTQRRSEVIAQCAVLLQREEGISQRRRR